MNERIQKIQNFLLQTPNDLFLNHALALEFVKIGEEELAQACFEKNKENDATYVATYYHLGKLFERTNQIEQAIKVYEEGMLIAKAAKDNHSYNELQAAYIDVINL